MTRRVSAYTNKTVCIVDNFTSMFYAETFHDLGRKINALVGEKRAVLFFMTWTEAYDLLTMNIKKKKENDNESFLINL